MKTSSGVRDREVSETKHPLPDGWRWARLEEVGQFESGGTPGKDIQEFWGGDIPFVTGADITELCITDKHARAFLTEKGLASGKTAVCNPGTVLLVTRTRVGRVGIAKQVMGASQDLSPFICGPTALPEYVCRYLMNISEHLAANCRGATIQGLTPDLLRNLEIPLPPLSEQRRITTVLAEAMDSVERARAATETQLEAAKALPAAYLRAVFSSSEAQQWLRKRLEEVCEFLDSRRIPVNDTERAKRIQGKQQSELYPYYGANGQVGWIDDYIFDEPLILLAEDGGFFGSTYRPIAYAVSGKYWVNNHAHVLRPKALIDFDYCLWSIRIRPDVGDMVSGSTRAKMNQKVAANISVPLPPLAEQRKIARVLSQQVAAASKAREVLEDKLEAIDALPAAFLRRAFAGEL